MSIVRICTRLALVQALKGVTLTGDNVHDSLIGGIEVDAAGNINIDEGEKRPFISIFTDVSDSKDGHLRNFSESGSTDVIFEWGITAGMVETNDETGESQIVAGLPATDDAMEFTLDLIGKQIANALNDPDNKWSGYWKDISSGGVNRIVRSRTSNDRDGTRLSAHQMRLSVGLMQEPQINDEIPFPLTEMFQDLIGLNDQSITARVNLMQSVIGGSDSDSDKRYQELEGLSQGELTALGLGANVLNADGTIPVMGSVTIDIDGMEPVEVND